MHNTYIATFSIASVATHPILLKTDSRRYSLSRDKRLYAIGLNSRSIALTHAISH
jgi:hypothetical protein